VGVELGPGCPGCSKPIPPTVMARARAERKDLRCKCGALRSWKSLPPEEKPSAAPQPLPRPDDSHTILAGKAYIESRLPEGVDCPCCGRNNKRYTRPLDAGLARGLVALIRASPTGEIVHVKDIPEMLVGDVVWTSHDFAKARYWGLCEEVIGEQVPSELLEGAERKRRKGFWRSTEKGRQFVYSMLKVPKYISLVNNAFEKCHGDDWSIQDALGHPFDFSAISGK
jgi:hypothetical protein